LKSLNVIICFFLFSNIANALTFDGNWTNAGYDIHIQNSGSSKIQLEFISGSGAVNDTVTYIVDGKWHLSMIGNVRIETRATLPAFTDETLIVEQKTYFPDEASPRLLTHKYFKVSETELKWNRVWSMDAGTMSDDQVLVMKAN